MRPLDINFSFLSYDGAASNDPSDSVRIKNRIQETDVTEVTRFQRVIETAASDVAITLPDAASEYLCIFSDYQLTAKINGSSDSITLSPRANGVKTLVFFARGSFSALLLSNAGATDASVDIIAVNK